MRFHIRNTSQGFTLIEMMITIGLLSIFLVVLATLFTASIDVQTRSRTYSAVSNDGRFLLAQLDYDITRASAVTTPAALGASASSLVLTISGNTYTYAISSGRLQLTDNTGADYLTSSDDIISGLSFTKIGNSGGLETVRYTFTLAGPSTTASNNNSQTLTSTVERRS